VLFSFFNFLSVITICFVELILCAVVVSNVNLYTLKLFIDINCWQHPSNLSASAAALFDTVLIARHIPNAVASSDLEHDQLAPSSLPSVTSHGISVAGDCLSLSSSAFSDCWSCVESQNLDMSFGYRMLYAHSEDFRSELGSISSTELSAFLDDSNEWPFVRVCDNHSLNPTNRQLPVEENFVAELKPRVPVSHGLILVDNARNCVTLSVRPVQLVKPCVHENSSRDNNSVLKVSNCRVPEKRKEVTLYISKVKSSVCNIEETETIQKVTIGVCNADKIQTDKRPTAVCPAADGGCSATVQSEKVGVVKYERCDIDKRLSVRLRDTERSESAEQLSERKHSLHSVSQEASQTHHQVASVSNMSTGMCVSSDEIHRAEECIPLEIHRSNPVGKYLNGCRMSLSCDNVAHLKVTSTSRRSRSQGNVNCKIIENRPYNLCRREQHRAHLDTRESDQGRSVKDISTSGRSLSPQDRLAVMGDTSASRTRHHSWDRLLPDAPDTPSYLHLSGRGVRRYSYQKQALKSVSCENIVNSYSFIVRQLKSEKKLAPPTSKSPVVRQTVVARQTPSASRIHYVRAASEPRRFNGILPHYTANHTFNSNLGVKSESLEGIYNCSKHDNEYVTDVTNVHYTQRTSLNAGLAAEHAGVGLSYTHVCSRGLSGVPHETQTVTQSDRTDKANTEELKGADVMCEQQSLDNYRYNGGFRSSTYDRDTAEKPLAEQPLVGGFDSCDQVFHSETVRSEDLLPVQSLTDAVSTSSLCNIKKPARLYDCPNFEGGATDTKKAGMEYVTVSTEKSNFEQLQGIVDVLDIELSEEMSETSGKKPAQPGCIESSNMPNSVTGVGREIVLDEDSETSRGEDNKVMGLCDTVNSTIIMHKMHDITVEVQSDDMHSRTTSDTPAIIVIEANNATPTHLSTTPEPLEQNTSALNDAHGTKGTSGFSISMLKDTAQLEKRLETSEMAVTTLNNGTQPVPTLGTCEVTASKMSESKYAGESMDSSALVVAKSRSNGVITPDAPEVTVNETKDTECSEKTLDTYEMAAATLSDFELTNLNVASHAGMTTNHSKMELCSASDSPELAVTLHVMTSPDADGTENVAAHSEKSLDTSVMALATLSDATQSGKTVSTLCIKTTEADDDENTRKTPTLDQVNSDDNDPRGATVDSVSDSAADSFVSTLAACDQVGTEMFSDTSFPIVMVLDDFTSSDREISASVSVFNGDTKSDSRIEVIPANVIGPQVDILAGKYDVESDTTAHGHICQVIDPCEEMASENSHKSVAVISNVSNSSDQTIYISGDEDVQVVSDAEITDREEYVQSADVLHVPIRSNEVLADEVSGINDSLPDVYLDLSGSLADARPSVDAFTDHRKADQRPMTQASDQVNSELRDGNACMCATVALAY